MITLASFLDYDAASVAIVAALLFATLRGARLLVRVVPKGRLRSGSA